VPDASVYAQAQGVLGQRHPKSDPGSALAVPEGRRVTVIGWSRIAGRRGVRWHAMREDGCSVCGRFEPMQVKMTLPGFVEPAIEPSSLVCVRCARVAPVRARLLDIACSAAHDAPVVASTTTTPRPGSRDAGSTAERTRSVFPAEQSAGPIETAASDARPVTTSAGVAASTPADAMPGPGLSSRRAAASAGFLLVAQARARR
jgi:hypothetical protein